MPLIDHLFLNRFPVDRCIAVTDRHLLIKPIASKGAARPNIRPGPPTHPTDTKRPIRAESSRMSFSVKGSFELYSAVYLRRTYVTRVTYLQRRRYRLSGERRESIPRRPFVVEHCVNRIRSNLINLYSALSGPVRLSFRANGSRTE